MSTRSCSSDYALPPIGDRLADKAICKDGTDKEANIDYEDHIAYPAEHTGWE